ncbi:hypothetical protein A3860_31550 [Niastella vici]|uniref:Lipoprotein n=1 Tax=Niastella vici TaxID=1703345 RepID=A0A1V9FT89_9BACT|nr:hypothetical protein [Niastella vici]OQP61563.1 hypothetical protein A3860_31550 [Niastella vici]
MKKSALIWTGALFVLSASTLSFSMCKPGVAKGQTGLPGDSGKIAAKNDTDATRPSLPPLDTALFLAKLQQNANGDSSGKWPVKGAYPNAGALLPFKRIVAYYGNFYSKKMGVLGEYSEDVVIEKLKGEIKKWQAADTSMEVIPAIHYIAVTAQGSPGDAGKYRLRMGPAQIDKAINMAKKMNALVFIDVQVALSTLEEEIPMLEKYLKMPNVHLGIDPEFSMKTGKKPGTVIGTMDATDINWTSNYLTKLVKANNLPPKILVVHRFTQGMVTNYKQIKLQPEVQIVMDMDGWGHQARKFNTYKQFVYKEPVQFTGFKLFYKNDLREAKSHVLTPAEVLKLKPQPIYIQYQ